MKFRKVLILVAVAAVLLVLNGLKKIESERTRTAQDRAARAVEPLLARETAAAFVDRVEIRKGGAPDEAIILAKKDDGEWAVENRFGLRANKGTVENLIRTAVEAKGEVRSNSKEVLKDFSLEESQAYLCILSRKGGGEIARILLSPIRPAPGENFARLAGSNRVLDIHSDALSILGIYAATDKLNYKVFADMRVLPVDAASVTRIETAPGGSAALTLAKKEGTNPAAWNFVPDDGAAVDAAKANEFLSIIANLSASDVLDPAQTAYGFDEKRVWIALTEAKGGKTSEHRLLLGSRSEDQRSYYLKALPENRVFQVDNAPVDALSKRDKASFLKSAS